MDFEVWEGYYREILSDFGFSKEQDEQAALVLAGFLKQRELVGENELEAVIKGKNILVVGGGRNLKDDLPDDVSKYVIIAADGTTTRLLKEQILPDIMVSDLDGRIEDQIKANEMGAVIILHAHGDNIEAIRKWAPRFSKKVTGTSQCRPPTPLFNFGGFTDGDRGVFLAHHFNAADIKLIGFDFEEVGQKSNCDPQIKLRKLKWAKRLISELGVPL